MADDFLENELLLGNDSFESVLELLKRREENFQYLLDHSSNAILIGNENGFIYINEAGERLLGISRCGLKNGTFDFVEPQFIQMARELIQSVIEHQTEKLTNLKLIHGNQEIMDVELHLLPSIYNRKQVVLTIVRDNTQQKRTQEVLQQSEKLALIGEMAAGIAHEIRNPLTSLRGFIQLMKNNDKDPRNQSYFTLMISELDRIHSIVNELLMLAKPKLAHMSLQDPIEILKSVIILLGPQLLLQNVEVQTKFAPNLPFIRCEENKLKQVLLNILNNAAESMKHGGVVRIEAVSNSTSVIIRISDQGTGISHEYLSRVGQAFFSTKEKGTGLGLMVSYSIIRNHNGDIQISSEENKGTTVEITLPAGT